MAERGTHRMTIKFDLPPHIEEQLREEAASSGQQPDEYARSLVQRQLVIRELETLRHRHSPQSLDELHARRPSTPGKSWLEEIRGQWPGDETDAEIDQALESLS